MTEFSVLLPAHNEEELLPHSLPSIIKLNPTEILLMLDRCTDDTAKVGKAIAKKYGFHNLRLIAVNQETPDWKTRLAYLRYRGSTLAKYDRILFTSCDLVLDFEKIKRHLDSLVGSVQFISFWHNDYPCTWATRLKRLFISTGLPGLGRNRFLGGTHYFNRKVAFKLENLETLKKIESAEDTHLLMAIATKFDTKCIVTDTIHLRPRGSERNYLMGRLCWSVSKRSFLVVVIKAVCLLQLGQIRGYIHERFG